MKRFVMFVFVSMILFTGCTDSKEVRKIKNSKIETCPGATVGQMVESSVASPSWESGKSNDGKIFVNIAGDITDTGTPVHVLIQFIADNKNGQFEFQVLEFNQVPQMNTLAVEFMKKMCLTAGEIKK